MFTKQASPYYVLRTNIPVLTRIIEEGKPVAGRR